MTNHEPKHPPADALLPCPFCGGEAGVGTQYDPDGPFAFVNCTDCMASTNTLLGQQYAFTEAEAIAAWNNRKHPPADMAGLNGLTEITQADRDAAERLFDKIETCCCDICSELSAQAFARHRATQLQALAARVKVLEAENERLREALTRISGCYLDWNSERMKLVRRIASEALGEQQ